ncbi:hypothetical protein RHOER0001_4535 [Rhodococcus erythropolis SK121]|nr:hypothetical protein RHOER0001_4535 [Rhodococcus erythropolis SK121]
MDGSGPWQHAEGDGYLLTSYVITLGGRQSFSLAGLQKRQDWHHLPPAPTTQLNRTSDSAILP